MISKNEIILLFVFVCLDQLTTFVGYFYYHFAEINLIGSFLFNHFKERAIILTFMHEFLLGIVGICFIRFLRTKVFNVNKRFENIILYGPMFASLLNVVQIILFT